MKLRIVDLEFVSLSAIGKRLHSAGTGGIVNILKQIHVL